MSLKSFFHSVGNFFSGGVGNVLGGISSGVGSLLGARSTNKSIRRINTENIANQNSINDLNYQRQIEFFNRTNAYNHPAAVMQRYKEAGINPNLVASHVSGGLADSPVFRAEAGTARAPLSNSNFMSHAFNILGNVLSNAVLSNARAANLQHEEKLADISRKNITAATKLADSVSRLSNGNSIPVGSMSLIPSGFYNSYSHPKRTAWKNFFIHLYDGVTTPAAYSKFGSDVYNKVLIPASRKALGAWLSPIRFNNSRSRVIGHPSR